MTTAEMVNLPWREFEAVVNGLSNADWLQAMQARLTRLQAQTEGGSLRQQRAQAIVASGGVRKNGTGYYVASQSQAHTEYWASTERCTCPDYKKRGGPCKHMLAVRLHTEGQAAAERAARKAQVAQDIRDIWG